MPTSPAASSPQGRLNCTCRSPLRVSAARIARTSSPLRLRELHGLEASRGGAVERLPERVLREEPLDAPAPDVRGESEHGVRVRASAARLTGLPYSRPAVCVSLIRSVFQLLRAVTIGAEKPPFKESIKKWVLARATNGGSLTPVRGTLYQFAPFSSRQ